MRRLPIYFLLDVSDSMVGQPRQLLEKGIKSIIQHLRSDPHALETAHVSVIAFAGKAKQLVSLTDLINFTPPKLPIGSGTALGLGVTELMKAMQREIIPTTKEQKGDWKPLVYILTDGKPTDSYAEVFTRWQQEFAGKAHIMGIGLGEYAATDVLSQICEQVFIYNGENEQKFAGMIRWITSSISAVSESPGKVDLSKPSIGISFDKNGLMQVSAGMTIRQDQDAVILLGRCQTNKQLFLVKYDRTKAFDAKAADIFQYAGSHIIDDGYFAWSNELDSDALSVRSDQLWGPFACPYCGANYGGQCGCGKSMCMEQEQRVVTCPWCDAQSEFSGEGKSSEITRSSG